MVALDCLLDTLQFTHGLVHLFTHLRDGVEDVADAFARFGGELHTLLHLRLALLHRLGGALGLRQYLLDDEVDFACGVRAAFGEAAHLFGDDSEAAPRFTCPRRFNRCVQRQ
jgi:hypothetical protein